VERPFLKFGNDLCHDFGVACDIEIVADKSYPVKFIAVGEKERSEFHWDTVRLAANPSEILSRSERKSKLVLIYFTGCNRKLRKEMTIIFGTLLNPRATREAR